ncbi:WavE lipopolysaccharide synthesis family protein [Photobacterium kishitanii]|uniref:WavE lipopolysaccharide synthesis family protein n=1 Tax=Photobacterium kishitanii TaxID=318456 RepID=UPI0015E71679|nr:WavE lipopolysaccharide synthesis family protein [Photobacterium kishitanii]
MNKTFKKITVVVQGPVQNYQERTHHEEGITQRCLDSIRTHLPDSKVILSTWPDQDMTNLDYDQLIINKDPGQNHDGFCHSNYRRQVLSTQAGLDAVTTPYAVKLRSDNFLTGNQFVTIQQQFTNTELNQKIFSEKVVVNSNLFRRSSHGHRVIMSPSDFFYYGRTDDLKLIWQQPVFNHHDFSQQLIQQAKKVAGTPFALEAEQTYCQIWLKNIAPNTTPLLKHRFDVNDDDIVTWERFLASNIIIADPKAMGLGLRKISQRKVKRVNEYSHIDWLKLYKKYCDNTIPINIDREQHQLELKRLIKLPLSKFAFKLRNRLPV